MQRHRLACVGANGGVRQMRERTDGLLSLAGVSRAGSRSEPP